MSISDCGSDVCASDLAFAHRVASIDSQAYGVSARNAARRCGQPKTDRMVADHMALWLCRQHARLDRPSRRLPMQPEMPPQPEPADPWERAIAQARREIRDLIETGDLDHDEMTARRSEEHTSELQSLMRISYAVFCLKKKK